MKTLLLLTIFVGPFSWAGPGDVGSVGTGTQTVFDSVKPTAENAYEVPCSGNSKLEIYPYKDESTPDNEFKFAYSIQDKKFFNIYGDIIHGRTHAELAQVKKDGTRIYRTQPRGRFYITKKTPQSGTNLYSHFEMFVSPDGLLQKVYGKTTDSYFCGGKPSKLEIKSNR